MVVSSTHINIQWQWYGHIFHGYKGTKQFLSLAIQLLRSFYEAPLEKALVIRNITRFKIVLQGASVAPRSSSVYFWTHGVIVFIILMYACNNIDSNICWQIELSNCRFISSWRVEYQNKVSILWLNVVEMALYFN